MSDVTSIGKSLLNYYAGIIFPDSELSNDTPVIYRESEPECHCDIRVLMSQEHPAGCAWMQWRKRQPLSKPIGESDAD